MEKFALPKVSLVIPTRNRIEFTIRCLQSARELSYPKYEIIVVDNASTDGTPDIIREQFPGITVISNKTNLGYAGGCNLGIEYSTGDCVLLLNNDTIIVDKNLLEVLAKELYSSPAIAAVCPRIVDYDDYNVSQFDGKGDNIGFLEITGVSFLIKKEALKNVGMFDPIFFVYYEDRDLFARLTKMGWLLRYVPSVRVAHWRSATSIMNSGFYHYYHNRNLLILMKRYMTLSHIVSRVLPVIARSAGGILKQTLETKDLETLKAWLRGYLHGTRYILASP